MYDGMMDPELIKLAQEQMSRFSPSELAKIQQQMMSNPELIKMATESMKNMKPADLKNAAEQLKYARSEDMAEIGEKISNATPEQIAAMRAHADAQIAYEMNAAQNMKKEGNKLHSQGRFNDAAQKYLLAKNNLSGIPLPEVRELQLACSLNLMSCYLKTRQYDECIKEGSEVLAYDAENVKALYRRGQAYKELGLLEDAVSDLSKAHAVSPDDETIADVLREARERLTEDSGEQRTSRRLVIEEITDNIQPKSAETSGLVIEEITDDIQIKSAETSGNSSSTGCVTQSQADVEYSQSQSRSNAVDPTSNTRYLHGSKEDPETIRLFQNFIANADPNTLASLSAGNDAVSPDMLKSASNMISKMSPEELQSMLQMASSFQGKNPYFTGGSLETSSDNSAPGPLPPNMSPDMLKTATDRMSKMSPEDLHKMFELASSLKGKESVSTATTSNTSRLRSDSGSEHADTRRTSTFSGNPVLGDTISRGLFSDSRSDTSTSPNFPPFTADLQEQMRNQMKDPAMQQVFTSMIKNMSPEMMSNMSEQFGVKLSREEAEKAQQAMSSLSPDALDRMMRWADRIQRGVEGVKKTKNWLLGRPGMILAIFMLLLAIILHWLGYIGR